MTRVGTAFRLGARELGRTPVLLALLVVLPTYAVGLFALVAPRATVTLYLTGETASAPLDAVLPAVMAPMAAALVTAVAGLSLVSGSAAADGRLVVAGYRPREVLAARLGLLCGVAALASLVAVGVTVVFTSPAHLGWFLAGTGLTALAYGLVGVLAGAWLDRLPAVYLLLFAALVDVFLFANPMAQDTPAAAPLLPAHFPARVAADAAFGSGVALGPVVRSLAYVLVLGALAVLVAGRGARTGTD